MTGDASTAARAPTLAAVLITSVSAAAKRGLKAAAGNDFAKDNGMRGPGGSGNIRGPAMHRGMGQHAKNDRFQRGVGIAVMLRRDHRDRLRPLAKEAHQQGVFSPAAADNDFIYGGMRGRMRKNKAFVVEKNGFNGERCAGARDIGRAQVEIVGAVADMPPQFFAEGFAPGCLRRRLCDKRVLQQLGQQGPAWICPWAAS